jgi:predicted Zn-dependent protease
MVPRKLVSLILAVVLATATALPAAAQGAGNKMRLIRDAEIEQTIREYATPIFAVAGMSADEVRVYLINDPSLNAFVAGGRNIFINTGLLIRAKNAGEVIGVIAHETGHIAGGHLVRVKDAIREAQIKQIITFLLGAGAAIASRDGRAAAATIGLGNRIVQGTFFKYTQQQERSADQFAVTAMDQAGISSKGLLQFMEVIKNQELLVSARQDPYMRTHPLTQDRIDFVRQHVEHSPVSNRKLPARFTEMHQRMRAKLIGFLETPAQVFQHYKETDNSIPSRYARAIAHHRQAETGKAIALMDSLIKERPRDPYFHELKGQILYESGRIPGAIEAYRKAVRLAPNQPLIRTSYAQAELDGGTPALLKSAVRNLRVAVRADDTNPMSWRLLGIAYGKSGNIGRASLALAEYALLIGDKRQVEGNVGRAEHYLKRGSPGWNRIQDIKAELARRRAEN